MATSADTIWYSDIMAKGASEDDLCRFATTVPKVKYTKDQQENNRRERQRTSIVSLLDFVMKRPSKAVDIWASIQSGLIVDQDKGSASSPKGEGSDSMGVASFRKVTKDFKVECFLSLPDPVPAKVFELMHLKDPHSNDDVFTQLFNIDSGDRVPNDCQDGARARNAVAPVGDQPGRQGLVYGVGS